MGRTISRLRFLQRTAAKEAESWNRDHHDAMAARSVEDVIRDVFLPLHELIEEDYCDWRTEMATAPGLATPPNADDRETKEHFVFAYRTVLQLADSLLKDVRSFQVRGYSVEHAEDLVRAREDIHQMLISLTNEPSDQTLSAALAKAEPLPEWED